MDRVWRYRISKFDCGGIVFANDEYEAAQKVKDVVSKDEPIMLSSILVWRATSDDDYNQENPDVLRVY